MLHPFIVIISDYLSQGNGMYVGQYNIGSAHTYLVTPYPVTHIKCILINGNKP